MDHDVMATKVAELGRFKDGLGSLLEGIRKAAEHLDPQTVQSLTGRLGDVETKLGDLPHLMQDIPALVHRLAAAEEKVEKVMAWYEQNAPAIEELIKAVSALSAGKTAENPQTPPG